MSLHYAAAQRALTTVEGRLEEVRPSTAELLEVAKVRGILALVDELEAAVELLRERLPEQGERPDTVAAYRKGRQDERAGIYRTPACTCDVIHPGARTHPAPDEWREGCPAHPERPS